MIYQERPDLEKYEEMNCDMCYNKSRNNNHAHVIQRFNDYNAVSMQIIIIANIFYNVYIAFHWIN